MKNLKVKELSVQEMKNVEGGFWPIILGGIFSMAVGAGVGYALDAIFPQEQNYYYY
ncbi:class IIb bacteriocin, lactobin A/cerein 7B family [Chryseobacterium potabilaquae]|uniref:Class IIb bacteriocin, lactobin A/cerein 7B family n=1 Tax=Chryseobacterium potabilaquae TaxID=2675057 RepID=A0A6N4X4M0_9FLAO|nr:class IIb bacteriocin, lactobin A/cerein 7B family [Chryseobacterium potabilaquae]CAA7193722.1 hypothetical protein CHRY9293_00134 [Chryseobacterium potabilaquae]